jgi:two-component system, OmpR family, response regulator
MIVDDDPNARDLLAATVRREGYRVIEATDGETALALAREWHPDVVTRVRCEPDFLDQGAENFMP